MHHTLEHCSAVLIDRNSFQRKLLRSLLRSSGFNRFTELDNLETGLQEAKRAIPDFIFADYDTAKASDLLRGISCISNEYLPRHTRFIMLMDNPTRPRVKSAISIGSHWVLCRPFSPRTLNQRIKAVLDPGSLIQLPKPGKRMPRGMAHQQENEMGNMGHLTNEMDTLLKGSRFFQKIETDKSAKTPPYRQTPPAKEIEIVEPVEATIAEDEDIFLL